MIPARIAPLAPRRRSLFARFSRWFARLRYGRVPAPLDAYEHSNPVLAAVACFELASERCRGIDPKLRALVELKVAARVGCPFCLDIGTALSRGHGVTERQVRELHQHATSDAFSSLERTALEFAVAMTDTPVVMHDALFERLKATLGERGMVELSAAIAWENFRSRMNHALGFQAQGYVSDGVCAVPDSAYRRDDGPERVAALG